MSDEVLPVEITPPPGVVKTESLRSIAGRWSDTEKVRFVNGKPQKIGGFVKQTATPLSGSPRTLHAWRDNASQEYIGAGTYKKLYIVPRTFSVSNVTPLRASGTLGNNPFATTNGSAIVTVSHVAHATRVGDTVKFAGAATFAGITIAGEYEVASVPTVDSYTIVHSVAANATTSGGGAAVTYEYEITIGNLFGAYGLGYGVGPYGRGTYGSPRTASNLFIEPRVWAIDHFGQILLCTYNTGKLYKWDPSVVNALTTRASVIADAPTDIRSMFVTPERFVIALCDLMNIKWCTQGDFTVWTPTALNTANIRGVTEGTKLVGGRPLGGGVSLIWSDSALYVHQYNGIANRIFDTRLAGRNCGLISPSAAVTVGSVAFWMGQNTFFMYDGAVRRIPNVSDIRSSVFDALDPTAGYICCAMYVSKFNEVWFFVSTQNAVDPGRYAIVNLDDWSWAVGNLTRVGGTYFSHGDTRPYWAGSDGHIYLHESGFDADGVAMDAFCTLAPSGLEKGKRLMDLEGIEPDFHEQSGDVSLTINAWDRIRKATDTPDDSETQTITPDDELVDLRVGGRYAGMTVRSNTLGGYFRMGTPTIYIKESGSRR